MWERHLGDFAWGVIGAPAIWACEATMVHSASDLIDFPQAAGFEAVASEAVH